MTKQYLTTLHEIVDQEQKDILLNNNDINSHVELSIP